MTTHSCVILVYLIKIIKQRSAVTLKLCMHVRAYAIVGVCEGALRSLWTVPGTAWSMQIYPCM